MRSRHFAMFLGICLVALRVSMGAAPAVAEYRVALVIDNTRPAAEDQSAPAFDGAALADVLGRFGFRCHRAENIQTAKQLRQRVEQFAATTPTASTALVCFAGSVTPDEDDNRPILSLHGADPRSRGGYSLSSLVDALATHGGSRRNLVLLQAAALAQPASELPEETFVAGCDMWGLAKQLRSSKDLLASIRAGAAWHVSSLAASKTLTGAGSHAISPPNKFMPGARVGDQWVDARGAVFVWCPPGRYTAGSPPTERGRYPTETQRQVVIEDGFWISKYELTRSENQRNQSRKSIATHKNHPLTMINYDDIRRMTQHTMTEAARADAGLPRSWHYSLPTEAQWEYAARAGTTTQYYFGEDDTELPKHANFADKSWYDTGSVYSLHAHRSLDDRAARLARVGSYQANPWGLHDIHGNVAEWCLGGATRGGSWTSRPDNCRLAFRHNFSSRNEQNFIGYRIVICKIPPAEPMSGQAK